MHFVFEDIINDSEYYNFIDCPDKNPNTDYKRFKSSPIVATIIRFRATEYSKFKEFSKNISYSLNIPVTGKYIIASGVAHSPMEWCGPDNEKYGFDRNNPNKKNLFEYLNPDYMNDIKSGRAFLLLDQSHEGYQPWWLWDWFHNSCKMYNISPEQIIYCTGNLECADNYDEWTSKNNITSKMLVLPYPHFETVIYNTVVNKWQPPSQPPVDFETQIQFKKQNIQDIKLYNALQKRPRAHRAWLLNELYKNNLLNDGINSMNYFEHINTYFDNKVMSHEDYTNLLPLLPILPPENPDNDQIEDKFSSSDCGKYLVALNDKTMLSTWFSVVSEASFGDNEGQCFISEKTFKPLVCYHPFIIFGNRNSLEHLRRMGYKTFHPYINETYDTLPTWERLDAIIKEISRLKKMSNYELLNWYMGMKNILEHNAQVIRTNSTTIVPFAMTRIKEYMDQ